MPPGRPTAIAHVCVSPSRRLVVLPDNPPRLGEQIDRAETILTIRLTRRNDPGRHANE